MKTIIARALLIDGDVNSLHFDSLMDQEFHRNYLIKIEEEFEKQKKAFVSFCLAMKTDGGQYEEEITKQTQYEKELIEKLSPKYDKSEIQEYLSDFIRPHKRGYGTITIQYPKELLAG